MSDTPLPYPPGISPGNEDPSLEPMPIDDGDDQDYDRRPRTLVPRTSVTAAAWLEQRAEAERILTLPAVAQVRAALSRYTCIGCGDALPAGRGGHCQSCIEWDD